VVRALRAIYSPVLRLALANRRIMLAIGLAFLAGAGLLATRPGSEFLPALEEGNYWIRASMPPTIGLDAGTAATGEDARNSAEAPRNHHGGFPAWGGRTTAVDASPFSNVELFAPLKPFDEWPSGLTKDKLTEQLQQEFTEELPGITFNFSQYIQDNIEEAISGVKGANSVKIVGPNLTVLERLADQVQHEMDQVRGSPISEYSTF